MGADMRTVLGLGLLVLGLGCQGPFHVITQNRVAVDGPMFTQGHITTDSPPVTDGGPVVGMPVDGNSAASCGSKVAILDVDGLILNLDCTGPYSLGENPVALFRERLDAVAADPQVAAVVLRINSPGGSVTATDIMWRDLQAFRTRKHVPIIACLLDMGTGGAYYLATAADRIIAHPTTITGGIGVILNLYNLKTFMNTYNILYQGIKAGPFIDMGTPTEKLSEETRSMLETMAKEFHGRFQQVVEKARPGLDKTQQNIFDGRVFTAGQALERKLIDEIGYLDDAIAQARDMAQAKDARAVVFHRPTDPARSPYAITPNIPLQGTNALGLSLPGLDRSRLPTFLYLWQPEVTMEKLSGK